ncbi:MAG: S41 family peptidase [Ferruginibacter sp.]
MQKKKINIWLPLLFSVTMIAGMFIGYKIRDGIPGKSFFYLEHKRPLQEVMDIIKNRYVDTVDLNTLSDTAIQAMLYKLDPHSVYLPAETLQAANEDIQGNFFGIGIEFNILEDTLHVINVLKDSPSFISGLQVGDKIIKANDSTISGKKISTDKIRTFLRGPMGSHVSLQIIRLGKPLNINVKRGMIPVSSIDASYMMNAKTGFIRINKFSKQTYREFMLSLEDLKKKGLQHLILDLRDNGGGVLEEAVEIADEFLEGDKLITYTKGNHSDKKEYRCRREGGFEKGSLVVLANEGSASASEVLMGALQDWDRATIIGRRSFGKGLVQEQYDLTNGAGLRLTVARYYTPVGRSIQKPYNNGGKAYYEEIYTRNNNGSLVNADSNKADSGKVYKTKAGKIIYGNGGISPDVFVAADTSKISIAATKFFRSNVISDFGYRYLLGNPWLKTTYKTATAFANNFVWSEKEWQFLNELAAKDSINLNKLEAADKSWIIQTSKAAIGRQLFRQDGYFQVMNKEDNHIKKAIEIFNLSK